MSTTLEPNSRCSIARSLEVLGEKWTLLVVREAFRGSTRFSQFKSLGLARDILSDRLATLVDCGVLERRGYRESGARERDEYVLTAAGRDLRPVLAALTAWGDAHRPAEGGPSTAFLEHGTHTPVHLEFRTGGGRKIAADDVQVIFDASASVGV